MGVSVPAFLVVPGLSSADQGRRFGRLEVGLSTWESKRCGKSGNVDTLASLKTWHACNFGKLGIVGKQVRRLW